MPSEGAQGGAMTPVPHPLGWVRHWLSGTRGGAVSGHVRGFAGQAKLQLPIFRIHPESGELHDRNRKEGIIHYLFNPWITSAYQPIQTSAKLIPNKKKR